METFSALLAFCAGNSPVTGEFPAQRPVMRCFDVFFDLRPNKRLSKQSWGWWFETPSHPLWCHCNAKGAALVYLMVWCPVHSVVGHLSSFVFSVLEISECTGITFPTHSFRGLLAQRFVQQIKHYITLSFVSGILWPVYSPHKEPVMLQMFPCHCVLINRNQFHQDPHFCTEHSVTANCYNLFSSTEHKIDWVSPIGIPADILRLLCCRALPSNSCGTLGRFRKSRMISRINLALLWYTMWPTIWFTIMLWYIIAFRTDY